MNEDKLFSDLKNFSKTESVLGDPLAVGDKTLIPVMSVTVGYGSTPSIGKNQQANNSNGVGLGARFATNAVIVVEKDSVSMLSVNEKNNLNQLMSNIPQTLMNMGQNVMQQGQQQAGQSGQQGQQNTSNTTMQGMAKNQQSQ